MRKKRGAVSSAVIPAILALALTYVAAAGIQALRVTRAAPGIPALPLQSSTAFAMPALPQLPSAAAPLVAAAEPLGLKAAPQAEPLGLKPAQPPRPEDGYYAQLRQRIRWQDTRMGSEMLRTPDLNSRMLLAKSAAQRAGLHEVGLGYQDVYGIINAETSWVPRTGASKDGTPNLGIAQFEPATARALGLRDPHDLVEAVHVAAMHMKEAAEWSADRIARLKLGAGERAAKLREGVSIYYNLSSRGRAAWNGRNTGKLPVETRRHIQNARIGAQQAMLLNAQLDAMQAGERTPPVLTAAYQQRR